ncbi:MAG: YkvA family protein [Siculibacillus sp.]
MRRAARAVPFAEDVVAGWYCALDPTSPRKVRMTLMAALAYFVAPIDVIPDVLPLVGFTDDAGVLAAVITVVGRHIRDDHREKAKEALREG